MNYIGWVIASGVLVVLIGAFAFIFGSVGWYIYQDPGRDLIVGSLMGFLAISMSVALLMKISTDGQEKKERDYTTLRDELVESGMRLHDADVMARRITGYKGGHHY